MAQHNCGSNLATLEGFKKSLQSIPQTERCLKKVPLQTLGKTPNRQTKATLRT